MYRYFKKLATESFSSTFASENCPLNQETDEHNAQTQTPKFDANTNPSSCEVELSALQSDPTERKPISHHHTNEHDEVSRAYIQIGPYQPRNHTFPQRLMYENYRHFNESWFDMYDNWSEYT